MSKWENEQPQNGRVTGGHSRRRIIFFGHFGTQNTGNESTLVAMLSRLRALSPDSAFSCICTNPEAVVARDGIDAVPITTREARIWDRDVRLGRRVGQAFVGVTEELKEYVRAFRVLRGTEMFIVPGTGLLTNAYGLTAWGPYNLFKWSLVAKARGCRLLFVSVGAGPLYGRLGRALAKCALSLADYRSYRDDSSIEYLQSIGFRTKRDPIYPDLAFSLPDTVMPDNGIKPRRNPVVGLGLMLYAGKLSVENPVHETYTTYLESLAIFVEWLLSQGYDVRLLLGDGDTLVIDDFESALEARLGTIDRGRIAYHPIASVPDVLAELAAADVVVATRFHNVLLSFVLNKPVIAISFHHKCTSLMRQMGLSAYCHDINQMNVNKLIEQFQELEANRAEVQRVIAHRVAESRRALDEQYDLLFGSAAQ